MSARWTTLDPTTPLGDARLAAGFSLGDAARALGMEDTPGARSTVASPEHRGPRTGIALLLERCAAYGLDVEIRVKKKSGTTP